MNFHKNSYFGLYLNSCRDLMLKFELLLSMMCGSILANRIYYSFQRKAQLVREKLFFGIGSCFWVN